MMSGWLWIVVGLIAAPIVWFVFKATVGFAAPPELSGKRLLSQTLVRFGVSPAAYGDECLDELVGSAKRVAQMRKDFGNEHFSNAFVDHLEATAMVMKSYELGQLDERDADGPIVKTLQKYRPIPQKGAQ